MINSHQELVAFLYREAPDLTCGVEAMLRDRAYAEIMRRLGLPEPKGGDAMHDIANLIEKTVRERQTA